MTPPTAGITKSSFLAIFLRNNQVSHRVSPIEFSLVWYRRLTPQSGTFPSCPLPTASFKSVPMKKFSPPQMKEVSFPTPLGLIQGRVDS
ncbi:DNA gyrase subunit A [Microcystis aeruginosa NIES-2549]|uniref:DNA gyrase subunit A n=1 Tax=Microcystis aeruginosa NIES-2549 TaxID=1641812 RepID=A0A0F6RMM1_MICAE|nr:DNA gyrase subunit A [Microcystis aeruginosa NIES-2549]AOC54089.1 DNA gyrase subunit A [Microcystis aeruginosa NIES-2481]